MRFLPTRVHGVLDYVMGSLLILAPWILGFSDSPNRAAVWTPVLLGISALLYSLMTRYELGLIKLIPMNVHLMLDIGAGLLLAVSPWLFGFSDYIAWPHVLFGLLEMGAGFMTHTHPEHVHTLTDADVIGDTRVTH